jgi:hypothetical protein
MHTINTTQSMFTIRINVHSVFEFCFAAVTYEKRASKPEIIYAFCVDHGTEVYRVYNI